RLQPDKEPEKAPPPQVTAMEEGGRVDTRGLLSQVGTYLVERTGLMALAELPSENMYPLNWIRFLHLPSKEILVAVNTLFDDFWTKTLQSHGDFPDDLLSGVCRFIGDRYRGQPLENIRKDIMSGEPREHLESMPSLGAAFRMLRKAFEWRETPEVASWGWENMLNIMEFSHPAQVQDMMEALETPGLLPLALRHGHPISRGRVALGTELGHHSLEHGALMVFPVQYRQWQALIGVFGPMHMNYAQVVHHIGQAADYLTGHLGRTAEASLGYPA
ncbi:MAG: hypothetical protein OEZ59_13110, partial [Deltaproteobacteria bacterium]|nr:hypothetical protein [Deltaproteobacteria bacterium]